MDDFAAIRAALRDLPAPDADARAAARARDAVLTKPPGALGRLEELAVWLAGWRGVRVAAPHVAVFAGDHGVAAPGRAEGAVSAFPAEVTAQMVANFRAGGAAANQLARAAGAGFSVHEVAPGRPTRDIAAAPAMDEAEVCAAMAAGAAALPEGCDLLVPGEMGIGNTTAAAAICHALHGGAARDWTGRGTGVDGAGLAAKVRAVGDAVRRAGPVRGLDALRELGGWEIAAMAGAILAARRARVPVILDGYICGAAAACLLDEAAALGVAGALDHCVAGHLSAEGAHGALLERLGMAPLLSLGMRLGEGSGAALAIGIVRGAAECHAGMATFADAGVSDG